jgi:iron complex outermembrane receptor protein
MHGRSFASRLRRGCAAGLMVYFLSAVVAAAQPAGQITGSVKDATGALLPDVTIRVHGADERITESGPDGTFELRDLPSGDYELAATRAGFAPAHRRVRLVPGEHLVVSLTLSVAIQEETVVTASKTGEQDIQTTPIAVSLLPGAELDRMDAHSVAQLAGLAPSVTFSQNSDYAQLTIRGIGSNVVFAGSDPSSAVYVDGVYIARPVMVLGDFLDLERIEVLRGPQGTLYGRNAVGGAVNLITKDPTNEIDASVRVIAGNLDTFRTEARVSGPLVRDRILGSMAILRGIRQGFVQDVDHPDHALGSEDVTAALGKIHFVFNRRADLLFAGDVTHKEPIPLVYSKVLAVKPGFQVDNPPGLHNVRASTLAENRTLQYGGAARFTARIAPLTTLTSLTAYRKMDFDNVNDADITELKITTGYVREIQHQWSEELTIAQERPRLTWIAGLFLFDEVDRQPIVVQLEGPRLQSLLNPDVAANSSAVFGQATVAVTRRLSATAGLRYTRERKSIVNSGQLSTLDPPEIIQPGSAYAYTDEIEHSAWTPRFGVDLRARDTLFAYASAARGFKSGGFNLTSTEAGRGYAPEWAWSYEAGLKTELRRGLARIRLAAFHTDYTDLQVQTAIRPGVIDISNAAVATIDGVEVEASARLTRALHAGGHLAWVDAEYDQYLAVGVGGITGDAAGHRLSNAPEWSGRLWLEWTHEVGHGRLISLRADFRSQSTVYFTPFNDDIQRQRPYGLLDVGVEFAPSHGRWSLSGFARNLTNQDYITGSFSSPPPAIGGRPGEPRQIGIQLALRR